MSQSPLRALVAQSLRPISKQPGILDTSETYLELFEAAARVGAEAVSGSGAGLDHFAGERVLASVFFRDTPKGYEHRLACAITDRRTCLSGWSSMSGPGDLNKHRFALAHAELQRAEVKRSLLSNLVALFGPAGKHELPFVDALDVLGPFYQALAQQLPPHARVEPPTPFVEASEGDPSGAASAARSLWFDDPAAREMLSVLEQGAHAMGIELAGDLVRRVVLAHRSRAGGPGMVEGRWLSPMSAQDFGHTLVRIYGPPMAHAQPQPGVDQLDFRIDPRRDPLGAAVTALGLASYVALGVGFSPGKVIAGALLRRQPVTQLRVMFAEGPGLTAYRLLAPARNLEECDSMMAHALHQTLIAASYRVLYQRCHAGWGPSYDELMPQAAAAPTR